jgi:UDP-N-acetyl-2-amino-2-deoxyglucuronate dehydrogenase
MPTAGIIGCGDVSVVHFEALANISEVLLVGVCDSDPARLAAAAEGSGVPGFADHRRMLAEARPDVVHICTPHNQHGAVAVDCLQRGVSVVVEKPVATTIAAARELIEVAEASSAKSAVCFQNRYNTTSQAMHRLLSSGQLGKVLGGSATVLWHRPADYYRDRPWRGTWVGSGGGLLMNQAIHTVDLLQWMLGEVTTVSGHAATRFLAGVVEVEDTAEFVLTHQDGVRSVFYGTLGNVVNAPATVDIVTEEAVLSLRGDLTVSYSDGRVEVTPERKAATGGRAYWGVSHELMIRDFYARLDEDEPFWLSPREAEKSLRIVKGVYQQTYPNTTAAC